MILFWTIGAALAALALAMLLRPLLARPRAGAVSRRAANIAIYRDQARELEADLAAGTLARADYERARAELEARVLEDAESREGAAVPAPRGGGRAAGVVLAALVPLAALVVYFAVGTPAALAPQAMPGSVTAEQIEAMVEGLAARLRENPDDVDGWKMLGRSYAAMGRFGESVDAYAKAALRAPRDAQLLADFADALAMSRGQSLQGEPERLVLRALEIEPGNLKALALAGTAAFERGDHARAAELWERMLTLVPPDSEDARIVRENVAEARSRAGGGAAAAPRTGLRGTVRIAPELKGRYGPEDPVFIYARAVDGPAMPLAILRRKAGELPLEYALDDSMAMAPGLALSSFPRIVVTARIARTGEARPQPGDLQGASAPVANDAAGVEVTIDTVVR
jgi:cytochrome c-type biogenesis protein CcmH